jgi:hypothetical protein
MFGRQPWSLQIRHGQTLLEYAHDDQGKVSLQTVKFCARNDAYEYSLSLPGPWKAWQAFHSLQSEGGGQPKVKLPIPDRDASRC